VTKLPAFIPPQLCRLLDEPPDGADWIHEIKFDGYRVQMRVEAGRPRLLTRKGLDWTARFPEIAQVGAKLPDGIIDGEIVALNKEGMTDFGLLQDALSTKKTSPLVFFTFDCLFLDGHDLRQRPLRDRKEILEALLRRYAKNAQRLRFVSHFASSGEAVLSAACSMDLEGIVSKRLDAPYRSGRSDSWTKAKCRGGQEVVIGGWRGSAKALRSLLVGTYQDGTLTYMGRVGTGFNARVAADLLKRLRPLKRSLAPFKGVPRLADVNWAAPHLVAEIAFENVTSDGLFRQASFKGLRLDKDARSVIRETTKSSVDVERDAGMDVKKRKAPALAGKDTKVKVSGIVVTHADKELWPATKTQNSITKRELAEYYALAARRTLPHVAERPISVVRTPDGIEGETFYQRHTLLGTAVPVLALKVKGEAKPFLGVDTPEALVALGQAGVTEIHPWGSRKGEPDVPERIILDLDPAPDLPFARVVEAALALRTRLTKLGLVPFVKTTGGKGLHVVVAVKGTPKAPANWADAKAFAKAVAVAMEREEPQRYTTTISKKARTGKIFIDYLRNDRTSTGVAPWSPRARPGAPIAVPVSWAEVKPGLNPSAFTIANAASRLKKPDPWKDLASSARSLDAATRRLMK